MFPGCTSHSPHRRRTLKPPSSAILAVLATIAGAATPANASPAPPVFLCPSVSSQQQSPPSPLTTQPKLFPRKYTSKWDGLPDKYEVRDGVWRRVDVWTLYGSTVCVNCEGNDAATAIDSNNIQPSMPPAPPSYDIRDTLPPGWRPTTSPTTTRITLILGLSLVLSFIICLLILACVFWRRANRRRRQRDVEKRLKRQKPSSPSDDSPNRDLITEKELKIKQKLWAKATARWKSNARYSARFRRGKRTITIQTASTQTSTLSLDRPPQDELGAPQEVPSSPTPSHASTIEELYAERPPAVPPDAPTPADDTDSNSLLESASVSSLPLSRVSPPAYHRGAPVSPRGKDGDRPPSSYSLTGSTDPQTLRAHAAHVATDDKALLAQLANMASAPPAESSGASTSTSLEGSAPLWDDDDLDDYRAYLHTPDPHPAFSDSSEPSSSALFPPPPSKGKMASSYDNYRYSFEDLRTESPIGPSAPPFESSAPPLEDQPSCPPLDYLDFTASAPPLSWLHDCEGRSNTFDPEWPDEDAGRCQGTREAEDPRTTTHLRAATEDTLIPSTHGPIPRDGIRSSSVR